MDTLFWLTITVIFLATLAGTLLRRLSKDKCLSLMHDHHVSFVRNDGEVHWGDLHVSSQGIELSYDGAYTDPRGLAKTSHLVFADELQQCGAVCRTVHGLTDVERQLREAQIRATFRPSAPRRLLRGIRNGLDLIRDAITKSAGLFVGTLASRGRVGKAVHSRKGEMQDLGTSLVGAMANAFEPLLERHIGRPVVIGLKGVGEARERIVEFPGYLVEYTEHYLAIFNVDHDPVEVVTLDTSAAMDSVVGVEATLADGRLRVTASGDDALVLKRLDLAERSVDLGVVLAPGGSTSFHLGDVGSATLEIERTRYLDWVCPRAHAIVRFGAEPLAARRPWWSGVAPEEDPDA